MQTLLQDLRYGARMLLKKPGFTLIAVITLALGIGANTAIFSVVNAVLLRPLPFPEQERLMVLGQTYPKNRVTPSTASYPNFSDWKNQSTSFDHLATYYTTTFTLTGRDEAARLNSVVMTHDLLDLLGVSPKLGRGFRPEEDQAGGGSEGRPALLSWDCWRQRFGGDPNVMGREITLNGREYRIVGVMPAGFNFPIGADSTDVWVSTARDAEIKGADTIMLGRGYFVWNVVGRIKREVTRTQAQAEMDLIAANLAKQFPRNNTDVGIKIAPMLEPLVGDVKPTLLLLFGAVGFVLLIACVNVANLLLERAIERQKEITVRLALGASRWRIIRQMLTESVALAILGGALGIVFALWGTHLIVSLSPEGIARITETRFDLSVLLFTGLAAMVTGVIFGLVPALAASRVSLTESLKESGRGSTDSPRLSRTRSALVVMEVAMALVLLVGAGLLVQSLVRLQRVNPGFDAHNVLTLTIDLPGQRSKPEQAINFFRQAVERVKSLPGVSAASAGSWLPLSGDAGVTGFNIEGRTTDPATTPRGQIHAVSPSYFQTLSIPLIKGRDFTAQDNENSAPVLIINEALANQYFPNEDPIGKRIQPGFSMSDKNEMKEIVGIVGDVKHRGLSAKAQPEIYFPHAQMAMSSMTIIARTANEPHQLINAVRSEMKTLEKDAPVYRVRTFDEFISRSIAESRFNTLLIGLFAALALVLTVVGLYGVISCAVSQATHEIGIRMALGAQTSDVMKLVLMQGITLTVIGLVIGLTVAFGLTRLMSKMLFGVQPTDPLTFVVISLLLLGVTLVACYLPARRATKVDPMVALRYE